MRTLVVLRRQLKDRWLGATLVSLGLALFSAFIVGSFDSYAETGALTAFENNTAVVAIAGEGASFASPEGLLAAEFTNYELILGLFLVFAGAAAVAGEGEARTLELALSTPVRRWEFLVGKALALALYALAGVSSIFVGAAVGAALVSETIPHARVLAASMGSLPFFLAILSLSLLASVAARSRRQAAGIAAGVYFVSLLFQILSNVVRPLDFLEKLSLHAYLSASAILVRGEYAWGDAGVLVAVASLAFAAAIYRFEKRDLR